MTGSSQSQEEGSYQELRIDKRNASIISITLGLLFILSQVAIAQIYGELTARNLLEAAIPSARSLGTGVVTANATLLALMLTMISLISNNQFNFAPRFFNRLTNISALSTAGLIAGVIILLLLTIPVQETQGVPNAWYQAAYYFLSIFSAVTVGLLVALVWMLYRTIMRVLVVVHPNKNTKIIQDHEPGEGSHTD